MHGGHIRGVYISFNYFFVVRYSDLKYLWLSMSSALCCPRIFWQNSGENSLDMVIFPLSVPLRRERGVGGGDFRPFRDLLWGRENSKNKWRFRNWGRGGLAGVNTKALWIVVS